MDNQELVYQVEQQHTKWYRRVLRAVGDALLIKSERLDVADPPPHTEIERVTPVGEPEWGQHLAMAISAPLCLAAAVLVVVAALGFKAGYGVGDVCGESLFWAALALGGGLGFFILVAVADFRSLQAATETIINRDPDKNARGTPRAIKVYRPRPEPVFVMTDKPPPELSPPEIEKPPGPDPQLLRFREFCLRVHRWGTIARRACMSWHLYPPATTGQRKVSRREWELWRQWFADGGLLDDQGNLRARLAWSQIMAVFPDLARAGGPDDGREGDVFRAPVDTGAYLKKGDKNGNKEESTENSKGALG